MTEFGRINGPRIEELFKRIDIIRRSAKSIGKSSIDEMEMAFGRVRAHLGTTAVPVTTTAPEPSPREASGEVVDGRDRHDIRAIAMELKKTQAGLAKIILGWTPEH